MKDKTDVVLVTLDQAVEAFGIKGCRLRAWILAGHLKPIRREGRGRGGMMYFARGQIGSLVYGLCIVCGNGFKKRSLKAKFCGKACRQRSSRMHAKSQEGSSHA